MNKSSGKVMYLKVTAFPCPEIIKGNNDVINTITMIITLNMIIRYLNFNENSPNNRYNKRKMMLRQQCRICYLFRGGK